MSQRPDKASSQKLGATEEVENHIDRFAILRIYQRGNWLPRIKVVVYREEDGGSPLLEWLDTLPDSFRGKTAVVLSHGLTKEQKVTP